MIKGYTAYDGEYDADFIGDFVQITDKDTLEKYGILPDVMEYLEEDVACTQDSTLDEILKKYLTPYENLSPKI